MSKLVLLTTILMGSLGAISCGEKTIFTNEMEGFEEGRLRIKYFETIDETDEGYLLTIEARYSEGKERKTTRTQTWLKKDFTLISKKREVLFNDEVQSTVELTHKGNAVEISRTQQGKTTKNTVPVESDKLILGDIHPFHYTQEVSEPGQEKMYWVFNYSLGLPATTRIKCKEKLDITVDGKTYECRHYMVRSLETGKYSDYYVSIADKKLIKATIGKIEMLPKKS